MAVLASIVSACASGPPTFVVESSDAPADAATRAEPSTPVASIAVGFVSMPPPGVYRSVRLHEDGRAETREVLAVNGPGPWVTYEGVVRIAPATARALVQRADAPPAAPAATDAPCVLARASGGAIAWQGCADSALAERVLAEVVPVTPAHVAPSCSRPVCQLRLVLAVPPRRHERYGRIRHDVVIDASGAFACATPSSDPREAINVLRVVGGRIASRDAGAVFEWLTAGVDDVPAVPAPADGLAASGVVVRGRSGPWSRPTTTQATAIVERWAQIAPRLAPACLRTPDALTSAEAPGH
jgi:hypothetical protein